MQNLLRALNTGDAYPSSVSLDEYLSTWFNGLWRLSLIPPVREHGAALVEGADGRLSVAAARPGYDAEFPLKDEEMREEGFVGYFHTHPYESGFTGVAFSATDLRLMINDHMNLSIVQSGDDVFMVVRTRDTPKRVAFDEISKSEFNNRVAVHQLKGVSWPQAVLRTNLQFCRDYGLDFYAGKRDRRLERR